MDGVDNTAAQLNGPNTDEEIDTSSCLAVLIDLHGDGWISHSSVPLWDVIQYMLVLVNAHIALDSGNELVVIGYNGCGTKVLYSSTSKPQVTSSSIPIEGTMIRQFRNLDETLISQIRVEIEHAAEQEASKTTSVAGPLSLALTYLNRHLALTPKQRGHILVVSATPENIGSKYIPAMNSIFTAQKLKIPIDVANFGPPKSFLQQAADFTGGSYLNLKNTDGLIAIFASTFMVDPAVRKYVNLATKPDVDFSAVCFLTKNVVEVGFVCSVCLCIMEHVPETHQCPVCGTTYNES